MIRYLKDRQLPDLNQRDVRNFFSMSTAGRKKKNTITFGKNKRTKKAYVKADFVE